MNMNKMGELNQGWGICGFTSSFYAMYALNFNARGRLNNANNAFRVLAEIKTYLMILKAEGQQRQLKDIEDFTKTFPGYEKFSIDGYIASINDAVSKTEEAIKKDSKYSIALPPEIVADYLMRIWDCKNVKVDYVLNGSGSTATAIIGVMSTTNPKPLYGGLCHYMFRHQGFIYSWGEKFNSLSDVNTKKKKTYQICCEIKIAS